MKTSIYSIKPDAYVVVVHEIGELVPYIVYVEKHKISVHASDKEILGVIGDVTCNQGFIIELALDLIFDYYVERAKPFEPFEDDHIEGIESFIAGVEAFAYKDYDGFGEYYIKGKRIDTLNVLPSMVKQGFIRRDEGLQIIWYSK